MTSRLINLEGTEAKVLSPSEFAAFVAAEVRKWPPRIREIGLKPN